MGAFSRNKGKRGEREVINALLQPVLSDVYAQLRTEGLDVSDGATLQRNTLQSDRGGYDITGLPWLALEIKNCATLQVETWWRQAVVQATGGAIPVLVWKVPRKGWEARLRCDVANPVRDGGFMGLAKDIVVDMNAEEFLKVFRTWCYHMEGARLWRIAQKRSQKYALDG